MSVEKHIQSIRESYTRGVFSGRIPQGNITTAMHHALQYDLSIPERIVKKHGRWPTMIRGGIDELKKQIKLKRYIVFSGGACNVVDEEGNLIRNKARDRINAFLSLNNILFVDPQIDEDTHGREYIHAKDAPVERLAIDYSINDLLVIDERTIGVITLMKALRDKLLSERGSKKPDEEKPRRILYMHGTNTNLDSGEFKPLEVETSEKAKKAHYGAYRKASNAVRAQFRTLVQADGLDNVKILDTLQEIDEFKGDKDKVLTVRSSTDHIVDLFNTYLRALNGEEVVVYFEGGERDDEGNQKVDFATYSDIDPSIVIKEYIDIGNKVRKMLLDSLGDDSTTQIVHTEEDAILALKENVKLQAKVVTFHRKS